MPHNSDRPSCNDVPYPLQSPLRNIAPSLLSPRTVDTDWCLVRAELDLLPAPHARPCLGLPT